MIGLSEKLLHQFVEYMANRRMKGIGLEPKIRTKNKSFTVGRPLAKFKSQCKTHHKKLKLNLM